jgi:hypothetical protein
VNDLRALTLIRPMSGAIVHGSKRIENRPQDLPKAMRGKPTIVAVHAGKKWDDAYYDALLAIDLDRAYMRRGPADGAVPPRLRDEGIVGLMILTGRVFTDADPPLRQCAAPKYAPESAQGRNWYQADPWWAGPFGYEIDYAVPLAAPIPCPGALGFWRVPDAKKTDELAVVHRALSCRAAELVA